MSNAARREAWSAERQPTSEIHHTVLGARISGDTADNRLSDALRQRRAAGLPIINLTESNPTRVGFDYPEDLLAPLADARGLAYEPHPLGAMDARCAVAGDYLRRGLVVDPERVVLTASTSEAYSLLFKLLTTPGDEVLVPRPSYPLFEHLSALDGVVARPYDLEYHGAWSIDFASVEAALGPRTRAVLVVSPNNPTGSFVTGEERNRFVALCAAREMAIIADEVFADYEIEVGAGHRAGSVLAHGEALVFGLGGLSKSIGLPQVKLGWMAAAGPQPLVGDALERLELICDTYLSVSTPVQLAARELLDRGRAIREQIGDRIRANYLRLTEAVAAAPSCRVLKTEGGWNAVLQVPTLGTEEALVVDLLSKDGVLVHPGYFFDFPRESYLVVSLLPEQASFVEGLTRLLARATSLV
jgi:aspartate/methionine/tyrosine aminotransferase